MVLECKKMCNPKIGVVFNSFHACRFYYFFSIPHFLLYLVVPEALVA